MQNQRYNPYLYKQTRLIKKKFLFGNEKIDSMRSKIFKILIAVFSL